jgi:hypothetical protein
VLVVDETGAAPGQPVPGLQDIVLLPLDAAGRSAAAVLLPDRAQLRLDVAGAARVLLPAGQGSLYRYRRASGAGAAFGFFRVDPAGAVSPVLELPGTGPASDADPFLERVAVDAAGQALLVGTTPAAGGDLREVDLAGGAVENRTANLAPLNLLPDGGRLLGAFGTAVAQQGIVRFARTPGAAAELVPVSGIAAPAYFDGGVAGSADGSLAATVAGASPALLHVITYGAAGPARALDPVPQRLSGAGYLPESPAGPYLALSGDGALAAWRTEVQTLTESSREAWIGRTAPLPGDTTEQITADAHFVDTLDETGLIGFVSGTVMLLGVGERADPANPLSLDIDGMDLYTAVLNPDGTTTLANASLTSGDPAEPFTKGELSTEDGVFQLPGGGALALNDATETLGILQPGTTGLQPLVPQTKELDSVALAGGRLLVYTRSTVGSIDQKLYAVNPAAPATKVLLTSLPTDTQVERHALRADGLVGVVVRFANKEWLAQIDLVAGTAKLALPTAFVYGPALGFAPGGGLALTAGAPGNPAYSILWPWAGIPVLLPLPIAPGQILPGAS